jgi:hypothetical protein
VTKLNTFYDSIVTPMSVDLDAGHFERANELKTMIQRFFDEYPSLREK